MAQRFKRQTGKTWTDAEGHTVPIGYITPVQKSQEAASVKIANQADKTAIQLKKLKKELEEQIKAEQLKFAEEKDIDYDFGKSFTMFSFDRRIKIERDVQNRIDFEPNLIEAARVKLMRFLDDGIDAKTEFIKEMILDAFRTRQGQLDAKRVLSLFKYRSKIKEASFVDALNLIDESINRSQSKIYYRIYIRKPAGDYEQIPLSITNL